MPVYHLTELSPEVVTPKHSTAFGPLVTGEQVELGVLKFKAGEGARPHAHPHEQIVLVLSGRIEFIIEGQSHEVCAGSIIHIPPNVLHGTNVIDDTEIVSCKGIVDSVGHRI